MNDDFDLPDGWEIKPLGEVATTQLGKAINPRERGLTPQLPYLRNANVQWDHVVLDDVATMHFNATDAARYQLSDGDLLVCEGGMVGRSAIWHGQTNPCYFQNALHRVRPNDSTVNAQWLLENLRLLVANGEVASRARGNTILHLSQSALRSLPVVVPPRPVIDALLATLTGISEIREHAQSRLATARRAIERFRRAVLAAACSGRLTADWRDSRSLGEWNIERADDACRKVQSGSTPNVWHTDDGGIPFLKVYNIVDQKLNFDYRPQFMSPELFQTKYRRTEALPGDVLMNIVGPPLGKVAIVTDQYPTWSINQAITLFRPSDRVSTDWLYIFLCSGISVAEVMNDTKGTVGQVNISLTQCRSFEIPIPTMPEQLEIARRVNALFTLAQGVASRVNAATRRVDRSSQAVLAKAFRGELVVEPGELSAAEALL